MALLGLLAIVIGVVKGGGLRIAVGAYCLLLSGFVTLLEFPYAPLGFIVPILNFFADYKFRVGFYVV